MDVNVKINNIGDLVSVKETFHESDSECSREEEGDKFDPREIVQLIHRPTFYMDIQGVWHRSEVDIVLENNETSLNKWLDTPLVGFDLELGLKMEWDKKDQNITNELGLNIIPEHQGF